MNPVCCRAAGKIFPVHTLGVGVRCPAAVCRSTITPGSFHAWLPVLPREGVRAGGCKNMLPARLASLPARFASQAANTRGEQGSGHRSQPAARPAGKAGKGPALPCKVLLRKRGWEAAINPGDPAWPLQGLPDPPAQPSPKTLRPAKRGSPVRGGMLRGVEGTAGCKGGSSVWGPSPGGSRGWGGSVALPPDPHSPSGCLGCGAGCSPRPPAGSRSLSSGISASS